MASCFCDVRTVWVARGDTLNVPGCARGTTDVDAVARESERNIECPDRLPPPPATTPEPDPPPECSTSQTSNENELRTLSRPAASWLRNDGFQQTTLQVRVCCALTVSYSPWSRRISRTHTLGTNSLWITGTPFPGNEVSSTLPFVRPAASIGSAVASAPACHARHCEVISARNEQVVTRVKQNTSWINQRG